MNPSVELLAVFCKGEQGGNPVPVVTDALSLSDDDMLAVARQYDLESGFVLPPTRPDRADIRCRFFVPRHEMEMCGHATLGIVWLLRRLGHIGRHVRIETLSGLVEAFTQQGQNGEEQIQITQPAGWTSEKTQLRMTEPRILECLRISRDDLLPFPIQNAATSRVKTLVPLKSVDILNRLKPDFARIEALCASIGSTGLYPYAPVDADRQIFEARQFPKSSGYPEDAATGIAATALAFGLLANGLIRNGKRPIIVWQGRAMGRPSEIVVAFDVNEDGQIAGCRLGGRVRCLPDPAVPTGE